MGRERGIRGWLEERGATWTQAGGAKVVSDYGDWRAEYAAIADDGLGIVERGERETLVISGDDTIPWLQGLVTGDLHDLVHEGSGHRNAWVNTTGRFVGEGRFLHLPQLLMVDLEAGALGGGLMGHLRHHIIMEDVRLDDRSEATWRVGLYGEEATRVVAALAKWAHPLEDRPPFSGSWARWRGQDLVVQRMVWMEAPGFEISCAAGAAQTLMEGLEEAAGKMPLVGEQAFEALRVEAGIPRFGRELHERVIPLEASYEDAISYEKGCYLGQEIIARLDTLGTPAKLLRRLIFPADADVPEQGAKILPPDGEGRPIGTVESVAYSPAAGHPVALAYIKRNHNEIGAEVRVGELIARLAPPHVMEYKG